MRHVRRYARWVLFFCLPAAVSHAETKERRIAKIEKEGASLLQQGKYPEAFAAFREGARLGSATSMTYLGYMCSKGMGSARNPVQGFAWVSTAAQQGDAEAEAKLGMMYRSGLGTTKDLSAALTWYGKAAQKGAATAEANLGSMYLKGLGVTRDIAQARTWLEKAAVQGNQDAKGRLALLDQQNVKPNRAPADSGGDASERSDANRPAAFRQ